MIHLHKIPGTTVLRERERIEGGVAEPGSEAAMEIARRLRDKLNNSFYMNNRGHKHRVPRVDPDKDQRTQPVVGRKGEG